MRSQARSAREAAVQVVRVLREAGHVAYLAGGCVRDALLGMEPKDYDVATDARPQQVRAMFRRSRYVGESFGVCLVNIGRHPIEVATFRSEWGYHDGRRPDHVIFTDAEHDAQRRDFTINGLFEDPWELADDPPAGADSPCGSPRIIDYVGGVDDLRARVVRAIGDPDERFGEDYLRMLRAVRFAARLDFTIEPRTAAAIRAMAKYLGQISRERIGGEVRVMLAGPSAKPHAAAKLMQALRLDGPALGEDHRDTPTTTLAAITGDAIYSTSLAAWMVDRHIASPDLSRVVSFVDTQARPVVARWRRALNLSNADRDALRDTLRMTIDAARWETLGVARRKRLLAAPLWGETLRLVRAIEPDAATVIEHEAQPLIAQGVAPTPLVTGDDLIGIGMTPGPAFGPLLDAVYDAQLEGAVTTRDEALAWVRGWRA